MMLKKVPRSQYVYKLTLLVSDKWEDHWDWWFSNWDNNNGANNDNFIDEQGQKDYKTATKTSNITTVSRTTKGVSLMTIKSTENAATPQKITIIARNCVTSPTTTGPISQHRERCLKRQEQHPQRFEGKFKYKKTEPKLALRYAVKGEFDKKPKYTEERPPGPTRLEVLHP